MPFNKSISLIVMTLLLCLFSSVVSPVKAAEISNSYQLTNSSSLKNSPQTNGKVVVWTDSARGNFNYNDHDIYAADLATGKEFAIANGPLTQSNPAIDGDNVIWQEKPICSKICSGPLIGKNLTTGITYTVATAEDIPVGWAISGNLVVYVGVKNGQSNFYMRDISTMSAPVMIATNGGSFAFDGKRLAWFSLVPVNGGADYLWQLNTILIGDSKPTLLDSGRYPDFTHPLSVDLKGNLLAYSANYELHSIDLQTGERRLIGNRGTGHPSGNVTTDGRYIFWEDYAHTDPDVNKESPLDIWGYDSVSSSYFSVVVNNGFNSTPQARNGELVWQNGKRIILPSDKTQIFAAPISSLLPSSPQPAFNSTNDRYYFPQTGHTLSFGFKYFWDMSGGLPVFGYPKTEEFSEKNLDTNQIYTVQYFERQRYEYHPEFKGTPYETELGRLGFTDAVQKNLTSTSDFVPKSANSQAGCQFFNQTMHNVCGSFLTYWQSHGLEFGDPGISFRESLALFGWPISEQFKDPATGLTIQYFERAVFEYHPGQAGGPDIVELRLLGNQTLQNQGWH